MDNDGRDVYFAKFLETLLVKKKPIVKFNKFLLKHSFRLSLLIVSLLTSLAL